MSLDALITHELARPLPAPVASLAQALATRVPNAMAVLFYGSNLRSGELAGVLDFYVLTEGRCRRLSRLLHPTVMFVELGGLKAKVGIMPMEDFAGAMAPDALSPHLWARFCQPVALAWLRDDAVAGRVVAALAEAVRAAAWWAVRLSPPAADPLAAWTGLFVSTYGAELRSERADRPASLVAADPSRWRRAAQLTFNAVSQGDRRRARRAWAWRRPLGRVLAALRLVKAAFTVTNGAEYIAWKIERHTGRSLNLTPWQRRHPLLAALPLLVRLRRDGIIR